jgi:hypothetical protein
MTHDQEHETWIRYYSIVQAREINRYASTEKVIQEAAKISNFILGKPPCEVVSLIKNREDDL